MVKGSAYLVVGIVRMAILVNSRTTASLNHCDGSTVVNVVESSVILVNWEIWSPERLGLKG